MPAKKLTWEEKNEQKRKEAEDKAAKRIEAEEHAKNKEAIEKEAARKESEEKAKRENAEKELKAKLSMTLFPPSGYKPNPVLGETDRDRQEGHYPSRVGSKNPSAAPSASTTPLPSVPNTPRQ